ncbi:unnamed protein product, partial [Didymodactylos carnosus]
SHSPVSQRRSKRVVRSRSTNQRPSRTSTSTSDECESIYSTRFDRLSKTLIRNQHNENTPPDRHPQKSSKPKHHSFYITHRHHTDTSSMKDSGYSDSQTSIQNLKRKSPNDPSYYMYNFNPQVEAATLGSLPTCPCSCQQQHCCCCCQCHSNTLNHVEKQSISSLNNRNRTRQKSSVRNQTCLPMTENHLTAPLSFDIGSDGKVNDLKNLCKHSLTLMPSKQLSSSSSYSSSPPLPKFESYDNHFSISPNNVYCTSSSKNDNYQRQIKQNITAFEHLSTSRSYPHIKPLPKTLSSKENTINFENHRRRKRHLSCDSSVWHPHKHRQQSLSTELLSSY